MPIGPRIRLGKRNYDAVSKRSFAIGANSRARARGSMNGALADEKSLLFVRFRSSRR